MYTIPCNIFRSVHNAKFISIDNHFQQFIKDLDKLLCCDVFVKLKFYEVL